MAKTAAEMVAAAKRQIENLTVEQTAAISAAESITLVDIREPGERIQHGAIPGAVSAPRGMLEFWADPTSSYHRPEFNPEGRMILHCASGGRSALAVETLKTMGYANVAHLDGGFNAWKAAGRPVEETVIA